MNKYIINKWLTGIFQNGFAK